MINLTFHGAARTTTGSMHLLEANGLRLLLDCGMEQGHRKEAFENNRKFPFDVAALDAVILSHAHIDHSGRLPLLARQGFRGRIFCTPATRDLCAVMLRDSARIQMNDVAYVNKRRQAEGKVLFEPLYTPEDVEAVLKRFEPAGLKSLIDFGSGVTAMLHNAGHILGSAMVQLDVKSRDGRSRRLLFSGDLGQPQPILQPPDVVEGADVLLIESTYADRDHPPVADVMGRLKGFVEDIHQQRARLIVPAFAVGRTQQLLYYWNDLVEQKRIPPTPIYLDSPLAKSATELYAKHRECFNEETLAHLRRGDDPMQFPGLRLVETVEESKALNDLPGPMIIISASGMCEAGRVLHHLKNNIGDPRNIILIAGFQAENTLGRRLVDHLSPVRIFGQEVEVRARIHTINALSAHADRGGLLRWFDAVKGNLSRAFAVHGEGAQVDAMATLLRAHGARQADAPAPGARFDDV
ncbi:MAG: MBL fold metallo-hydrolase [bacterium]